MESKILLESGTNELELLEFVVGTKSFGINIAKVSEIMMYREITPLPAAPEAVEGVFMPRDKLITVIDLHKVLNLDPDPNARGLLIVCEFNGMDIAFHVCNVKGIQRINWSSIEKPPAVTSASGTGIATGVAKIGSEIMLILDFEKIVADMNCSAGLDVTGVEYYALNENFTRTVVIAEDSSFLNKLILDTLSAAGFKNVRSFSNGLDAWEYISAFKDSENARNDIACLITDIEMPQMDGHRLTKLIKEDKNLKKIPVFLFSSLIDEKMRAKGEKIGADEQFSKPQIADLIHKLVEYVKAD